MHLSCPTRVSEVPGSLFSPTYAGRKAAGKASLQPQLSVWGAASQLFRRLDREQGFDVCSEGAGG